MYNEYEYIQGKQIASSFYSPRFCSTLPWVDHTENQGSELRGIIDGSDGYNSNACLSVSSFVGGKTKKQELVLFDLNDCLFTEPLILSIVCKMNVDLYLYLILSFISRSQWYIYLHGNVFTVEPILPQTDEWSYQCCMKQGDCQAILHTDCGNGWQRWWWIIYPIMKDYHVTSINRICLGCQADQYHEDTCKIGAFYLNTVKTHDLLLSSNCMFLF